MAAPNAVTLCGQTLHKPGHVCAFFNSLDDQYDTLVPYFDEGVRQGEQVINIVDSAMKKDHRSRLNDRGLSADDAEASGALKVLASEDTYTHGGSFAAARMYDTLQGALAEAKRKGRRVRTSGVMDWTCRGHAGTDELMEYEARVNVLVPMYDCTLLCVYDLNELSGKMVMDILSTHSYVIHRQMVWENPYYRPPVELLRDLKLPADKTVSHELLA